MIGSNKKKRGQLRKTFAFRAGMLVLAATLSSCAATAQPADEAFVTLSEAYAARDAESAAGAYSEDATVVYAYEGTPEERFVGRQAIMQSFASFFGRIDEALSLDLNFRIAERRGDTSYGYYRLRFGEAETSYGRFDVVQDDAGMFVLDRSSSATMAQFEEASGPLLVRPGDNELDRDYYKLLTGRYSLLDGCELVVTRSFVRLFVRNTCDQSWRGLERISGLHWTGGDTVLPQNADTHFRFAEVTESPSGSVVVANDGTQQTAVRNTAYAIEDVRFASVDGTRLAGTIYLPKGGTSQRAATVLVHGSGPQDRDGYASIIAVLADALATEGRVVLTYDKRGSGASQGNGDVAGFDILAQDAQAAMEYLKRRAEVDPKHVGLAGSSQAGWVVAKAIEQGADPADVFLLGAAGAAFTVREQNLYNTDVRMTCAGIPGPARRKALEQQGAFFDALADRSQSGRLDQLTVAARQDPAISDWLFPGSEGLDVDDAWFTVLDPSFDPLPIWRDYDGEVVSIFSEYDGSTDTAVAVSRIRELGMTAKVLPNAQHLGLDANAICDGELTGRSAFSPALFDELATFARTNSEGTP